MAHSCFNVHFVAAAAAAAASNSSGYNHHGKKEWLDLVACGQGKKSMNEKKVSERSCGGTIYISLEFNLSTKW